MAGRKTSNSVFALIVLFLLGLSHGAAKAQAPDHTVSAAVPVWKRMIAQLTKDGDHWAHRISSTLTVYDGDEVKLGQIESLAEIKLKGGTPTWPRIREEKTGHPGMVITIDLGIQKEPGSVLSEYDAWQFLRVDTTASGRVQVWRGHATADPRNSATVYLDEVSARPLRIEFTLPFASVLGTQLVALKLEYQATPEGCWLPSRAVIDQSGRILFRKRRVHLETEYRDWQPAPNSPSAPRAAVAPPPTCPETASPLGSRQPESNKKPAT